MGTAHHDIALLLAVEPRLPLREATAVGLHENMTAIMIVIMAVTVIAMTVTIGVVMVEHEAGVGVEVVAAALTVAGAEAFTRGAEVRQEGTGEEIVRHYHRLHHAEGEAQAIAPIVVTVAAGVARGAEAGTGIAGEDDTVRVEYE